MKKRKSLSLIALVLVSIMLVFAACEPVAGVNLDKALKQSYTIQSYEGIASYKLELLTDDPLSLFATNPALIPLAQGVEIRINSMKQQDLYTGSIQGEILLLGDSVPFAMSVTQEALVIEVEGISRPLMLDLAAEGRAELGEAYDALLAKASEAGVQMSAALADYLVPHLPNPDTISVKSEKITINGSSLNVHKVHGEIYGDEVLDLLRKLIMNLAEDEEGLRTLLDKLYDFLMPIIDETLVQTAAAFGDPEDDLILEWIQAYLHNKTLVTEFLFTTITQGYKTALSEFDELEEELASDEDIGSLLSPDSSLKIDLYLDRDLNIVRSDFELTLSPELLGEADGVNGIRLTGTQELWNLNGNVTADVLDDSNGISLDDWHLEDAILSSVEADSFLGQLLAASGLNTKQVLIAVDDFYAYLEDGVTMADVFWLSYDLGIDYVWHEDEGRVVLFDENSGRMATLVVGQNVIYVDGEVREIPKGPEEWSGDLYLPVRAVAEAFGYDVQWDEDFNMVILTKRYF